MSDILFTTDAGVATITLNRPDVLNSFNRPMARALREAIDTVAADVVAARLAQRERDSGRAAPLGPLAQLRTAQHLDEADGVRAGLRLRPYLDAEVQVRTEAGGGTGGRVLRSRAGDVDLGDADVPGVERLLAAATVADVLTDLDRDLVRRLVLAGVLVPE
jgi:hypothetical protein